jgi:hypothetical protein
MKTMKITDMEAWNTCERGDWMLWAAQKLGCPLPLLTLAKGKCAETVMHLMCDDRSRNAVKVAIDFGNGVASREDLDAAAADAADAAKDAFDDAFASYTAAASNASASASAAANADVNADVTADSAADACAAVCVDMSAADLIDAYADADYDTYAEAADAAADAAKKENQALTANICREILTNFIKSKL